MCQMLYVHTNRTPTKKYQVMVIDHETGKTASIDGLTIPVAQCESLSDASSLGVMLLEAANKDSK